MEKEEINENPNKVGFSRNPDGTFKKGVVTNPKGRPVGSGSGLKDYDRKRFQAMNEEHKIKFLEKIAPELRYRMAEGNPAQTTEAKVEVVLPTPLLEATRTDVIQSNNSDKKAIEAPKED